MQTDGALAGTRPAIVMTILRRSRTAANALLFVGILMAGTANARTPQLDARAVAAYGPTANGQIWEPAIAAGSDYAICAYYASGVGVQFTMYDFALQEWTATGEVDASESSAHDPCIAFNAVTGEFVVVARTGHELLASRFTPDPNAPNGYGAFSAWSTIAAGNPIIPAMDKPWIVSGEMSGQRQEFYVVAQAMLGGSYVYLRSIDGGAHWAFDNVYVGDDPKAQVGGPFGAQITVHDTGKVYLTCFDANGENVLLYEGADIDPLDPNNYDPCDPSDVGVRWMQATGAIEADQPDGPVVPMPLRIPVHRTVFSGSDDVLPGSVVGKMVPQLAIDPTDSARMYLVYYDTVSAGGSGSSDVDVYLRTLDRLGGNWYSSARIRVNNDDPNDAEHDQFIPTVTGDSAGYVNIVFYDDRDFEQDDSASLGKYNMYLAWCPPDDVDFQDAGRNLRMEADPDFTALDQTVYNVDPHEYNGIC